ncbi:MAG: DUF4190 domain-containing protein [Clostridia bacterium]|nr:DUF4190 domain-containing protein [Clostridia bacterium]
MDENNFVEPQEVKKNNTKAIVGFVCAIVGFLCCFPVGIVGLVFSIIALNEMRASGEEQSRGLAIAGIVIAVIGIIWQVVGLIAYGTIVMSVINNPDYINNYFQ